MAEGAKDAAGRAGETGEAVIMDDENNDGCKARQKKQDKMRRPPKNKRREAESGKEVELKEAEVA